MIDSTGLFAGLALFVTILALRIDVDLERITPMTTVIVMLAWVAGLFLTLALTL